MRGKGTYRRSGLLVGFSEGGIEDAVVVIFGSRGT